jgi:hypothetical protein
VGSLRSCGQMLTQGFRFSTSDSRLKTQKMEDPKEEPKHTHPPIIDQLTEYAETRIKLAKYKAIDGGSTVVASVIADLVVIITMVLAFVFASFTLAFFLGDLLDSEWQGFGCVTLLYLVIAIVCKMNKSRFERPITNVFIQKFFKN